MLIDNHTVDLEGKHHGAVPDVSVDDYATDIEALAHEIEPVLLSGYIGKVDRGDGGDFLDPLPRIYAQFIVKHDQFADALNWCLFHAAYQFVHYELYSEQSKRNTEVDGELDNSDLSECRHALAICDDSTDEDGCDDGYLSHVPLSLLWLVPFDHLSLSMFKYADFSDYSDIIEWLQTSIKMTLDEDEESLKLATEEAATAKNVGDVVLALFLERSPSLSTRCELMATTMRCASRRGCSCSCSRSTSLRMTMMTTSSTSSCRFRRCIPTSSSALRFA